MFAVTARLPSELIARLHKLQRWNGGFSFWPSSYYVAPWASAYATWGLLQAKKQGYRVSSEPEPSDEDVD